MQTILLGRAIGRAEAGAGGHARRARGVGGLPLAQPGQAAAAEEGLVVVGAEGGGVDARAVLELQAGLLAPGVAEP